MRKFKKILTVWIVAAALLLASTNTAAAWDAQWRDDDYYYNDDYDGFDVPDGYGGYDDDYSDIDSDYFDDYDDIDDDYDDDIDDDYDDYDDNYDDDIDDDYDDNYDDDADDDYDDNYDDDADDDYDDNYGDDTDDDNYGDDDIDDDDYDDDDTDDDYDDDMDDDGDDIDDDYDDDIIAENNNKNNSKKPAKKNTILTVTAKNCKVKVQSSSASNPTVLYYGTTKKKASVLNIPEKVTVNKITYKVIGIADSALAGNKKVKKIVVGGNVKEIGKKAFLNCSKLKQITIRTTSITSVGKDALKKTGKNLVIKVPKAKAVKYKKLFSGKGNSKVKVKAA